jgi:integrase
VTVTYSSLSGSKPKPAKPRPDFPLFPHATGRWAKKIRGKLRYFGKWDDPLGALEKYIDQRDDLYAGRTPRVKGEGLSVRDLLNRFLTFKQKLLDSGEIRSKTFADYRLTCNRIAKSFGLNRLVVDLDASDFERLRADISKTWGPVRLGNEIQRIRMVFKYALDCKQIDAAVSFGPGFKKPSAKVLRLARNGRGPKMFGADEIRKMLDAAGPQLRAAILLGVNCGYGNHDLATLPSAALDLETGWATYPRPKTGIDRRASLWPETVAAVREAIAARPTPKQKADAGMLFLSARGKRWSDDRPDNSIGKEFADLLKNLGIHRPGVGFYALRHTFRTVADGSRDQPAVNHVMGHAPAANDMASVYREGIEDARLVAVAEHVRAWLFGDQESK